MAAKLTRGWTPLGLFIALLGIPIVATAERMLAPSPLANGAVIAHEVAILAMTALLLWIVVRGERLPLRSIGIGTQRLGRSLGWGVGLAAACVAAAVACLAAYHALGIHYGDSQTIARALPVTTLTVVRAGICKEVCYRGCAIERLQSLTGSKWAAAAVSLIFFAAFHFRQGLPGVFLALVLGAVLTLFYLWKRDLVANIFAHFLVDFIPNVLLPLVGAGS